MANVTLQVAKYIKTLDLYYFVPQLPSLLSQATSVNATQTAITA
jgi:hypothetical protein